MYIIFLRYVYKYTLKASYVSVLNLHYQVWQASVVSIVPKPLMNHIPDDS